MVLNISGRLKKKSNETTFLDYMKNTKEQIDKETLESRRIESLMQNNILENKPSNRANLFEDIKQQNAVLTNSVMPDSIILDYSRNNAYNPSDIAIEDLSLEAASLNYSLKTVTHSKKAA